ncbi:RNAse P Rpr2/Rpp21/SNM1 subunit domain-containing protein [Lactarius quietus]|nr:RNAse P Rpr2/Rpp21/SNM1 subunit domain-containing protein [Lactarius quietus]
MGKKNKGEAPNPNGVVNRDILQRLNFLYQASAYLDSISRQNDAHSKARVDSSMDTTQEAPANASGSAISSPPTAGLPKAQSARRERRRKRRVIQAADIGQGYARSMRLIGQKTTVKMDPSVKRTLCKGCDTVLIPGLSATVRVNGSKNHRHLVTTSCLRCKLSRQIPAPPVLKPNSALHEDAVMDVDKSSSPLKSKRRRGPSPRSPPLFEREGHVIFRGLVQIEPKPS